MASRNQTLKVTKNNYQYLSDGFGVVKMGIFGSVAKDTDDEESDVDIVVEFKNPIGLKFIDLVDYLENLLQRRVDLLTPDGIDNIRIKNISDAIRKNIIYV
ncbi:MAG TPA: nucleotidyltransferase [Deltaproteobacteria bacterium]|nr:nucleotidyltransferase [Deltaproteobacteria bacterium]